MNDFHSFPSELRKNYMLTRILSLTVVVTAVWVLSVNCNFAYCRSLEYNEEKIIKRGGLDKLRGGLDKLHGGLDKLRGGRKVSKK